MFSCPETTSIASIPPTACSWVLPLPSTLSCSSPCTHLTRCLLSPLLPHSQLRTTQILPSANTNRRNSHHWWALNSKIHQFNVYQYWGTVTEFPCRSGHKLTCLTLLFVCYHDPRIKLLKFPMQLLQFSVGRFQHMLYMNKILSVCCRLAQVFCSLFNLQFFLYSAAK